MRWPGVCLAVCCGIGLVTSTIDVLSLAAPPIPQTVLLALSVLTTVVAIAANWLDPEVSGAASAMTFPMVLTSILLAIGPLNDFPHLEGVEVFSLLGFAVSTASMALRKQLGYKQLSIV